MSIWRRFWRSVIPFFRPSYLFGVISKTLLQIGYPYASAKLVIQVTFGDKKGDDLEPDRTGPDMFGAPILKTRLNDSHCFESHLGECKGILKIFHA
jgi:hypothetical protein